MKHNKMLDSKKTPMPKSMRVKLSIKTILIISLVVFTLGWTLLVNKTLNAIKQTSRAPEINLVATPTTLGSTQLEGEVRKDTPIGTKGFYYIVMDDNSLILLDPNSTLVSDAYINKRVLVNGDLQPLESNMDVLGIIKISRITIQ